MSNLFRTFSGLALAALLVPPTSVNAQGIADIMAGMRNGGGWAAIPIQAGHGTVRTARLPVGALSVAGCLNVWGGHSGTWEIEARESVLGSVLRISAKPGVGVPFQHDFGMQAQVSVDVRWSEPRDTTLMLWVGLDKGPGSPNACEPQYSGN